MPAVNDCFFIMLLSNYAITMLGALLDLAQKIWGVVLHTFIGNWGANTQLADNVFLAPPTDTLKGIGTDGNPDNILLALGYAGGRSLDTNLLFDAVACA